MRTSKHPFLSSSHSLISILSRFLDSHDLHQVDFFRYSIKWAGLPGTATLDILKEQAQHFIFPSPPTPLLPPKARLIRDLQAAYHNTIRTSNVWQSIILPDGQPPPFYMGALSNLDCGTSSAAIQLTTGHSFSDDYSKIFRKGADDNVICPCNYSSEAPDLAPVSPHSPGHFDRLMSQFLAPTDSPPLSPQASLPRHQCQQPRPRRLFKNTIGHVLFHCPLHSSPRHRIFGLNARYKYIFGTKEGGCKLGIFLRTTN